MILGKQSIAGLLLALFVATTLPAQAGASVLHKKKKEDDFSTSRKPTAAQNALIDKAIVREKVVVKTVKERAPLVETYIQNMKPDPVLGQVPESDEHFLGRVEFSKIIGDQTYAGLLKPAGRLAAKAQILALCQKITGTVNGAAQQIQAIYFTGFVIQ